MHNIFDLLKQEWTSVSIKKALNYIVKHIQNVQMAMQQRATKERNILQDQITASLMYKKNMHLESEKPLIANQRSRADELLVNIYKVHKGANYALIRLIRNNIRMKEISLLENDDNENVKRDRRQIRYGINDDRLNRDMRVLTCIHIIGGGIGFHGNGRSYLIRSMNNKVMIPYSKRLLTLSRYMGIFNALDIEDMIVDSMPLVVQYEIINHNGMLEFALNNQDLINKHKPNTSNHSIEWKKLSYNVVLVNWLKLGMAKIRKNPLRDDIDKYQYIGNVNVNNYNHQKYNTSKQVEGTINRLQEDSTHAGSIEISDKNIHKDAQYNDLLDPRFLKNNVVYSKSLADKSQDNNEENHHHLLHDPILKEYDIEPHVANKTENPQNVNLLNKPINSHPSSSYFAKLGEFADTISRFDKMVYDLSICSDQLDDIVEMHKRLLKKRQLLLNLHNKLSKRLEELIDKQKKDLRTKQIDIIKKYRSFNYEHDHLRI